MAALSRDTRSGDKLALPEENLWVATNAAHDFDSIDSREDGFCSVCGISWYLHPYAENYGDDPLGDIVPRY